MASDKQIEANRRNALLSTGPRTDAGKRRSRLNAYHHGLTGHLAVMTGEQKQAHDAFVAELAGDLKPVGAFERQIAQSIAETQWRINRVAVIENNIFAAGAFNQEVDSADFPVGEEGAAAVAEGSGAEPPDVNQDVNQDVDHALASARTFAANPERFHLLALYEMRLHRKAQADLKQLRQLQVARDGAVEKEKAEAARRKAAEDKQKADTEARRSAALQEAAWLYYLDEQEGKTVDPAGVFRHRNGFVFSNSSVREGIDYATRLAEAKMYFHRHACTSRIPHDGAVQ
jgi:hypothetical protein